MQSSVEAIKERPILFSGPMVQAILAGRKTQTRRIIKPQPPSVDQIVKMCGSEYHWMKPDATFGNWRVAGPVWAVRELMGREPFLRCPFGNPGDRLWVREAFSSWHCGCNWYGCTKKGRSRISLSNLFFRATHTYPDDDQKWVPGIFMPRWASRILLEVVDVRVERLLEITGNDVASEGFPFSSDLDQFKLTWNKLNAKRGFGWDANPWVWVVCFRRLEGQS